LDVIVIQVSCFSAFCFLLSAFCFLQKIHEVVALTGEIFIQAEKITRWPIYHILPTNWQPTTFALNGLEPSPFVILQYAG